ncbi:shikimate kinase [Lacinutrix salivirga]
MKVFLIGYMASGKSFIGKKLAKVFNFEFVDLDDYIELTEKTTIKSLFSEKGEIYFRKAERNALLEILNTNKNLIVALGGGTPCYYSNMDSILNDKDSVSVYLKSSINTLAERLQFEKAKRPLINHLTNTDDLIEFIGKHLFERSHFYNQAQLTVDVNREPKLILEDIILKLF